MPMSPAAAARHSGVSRSLISRALKSGELAGIKKNNGHWSIQEADLEQWMERTTIRAESEKPDPAPEQPVTRHADDIARIEELENRLKESDEKRQAAEVEAAQATGRLQAVEEHLSSVKSDRDAWKEQAETLAKAAAERDASPKPRPGIISRLFPGRG